MERVFTWIGDEIGPEHEIRARGAQIGTAYAEAFAQHLGHPHPQDDILTELLGGHRP